MWHPRLLISLLILASLLVDAAVFGISGRWDFQDPLYPMLFFLWALQLCQVSLVSIWLALGRTSTPLRLIAVLAVVLAWSWVLSVRWWPDLARYFVLLMMETTAVAIPLLIARLLGWCLWHVDRAGGTESLPSARQRWQFSILHLLEWTTVVAMLSAILKWLAAVDTFPWDKMVLVSDVAFFLAGHAELAWAALWAALGQGHPARRLVVFVVALTATVVMAWQSWLLRGLGVPAVYPATAALLLASLGVLRVAGYRFGTR